MPWRGPEEPGEFPTLGYLWADWIEATLLITDGPKMGQPFRLYDEQLEHLLHLGRVDPNATEDDNDAFQYSGSQWIRGQKWGKDPLLAAFDILRGFGPCDFAGWDADGEPVGRPAPSPWIFVAALNDLQANNTWLPLKAMVESSDLVDLAGVEVTQGLIRLPCGNPIERLTTTAFGRLGGRFTGGSLTENGLMGPTGVEGTNAGKRSPLSFAQTLLRSVDGMNGQWMGASNTWDPTEGSHAQLVYEAKDPHTYVDVKLSRRRVELDNDDQLRDELIYLYGDSIKENGGHVSSQRLMRSCRDKSKGETEVRRFFLSEILAGEEPLCTPERWAALDRSNPDHPGFDPLRPGERITLGFDGSRARDRTVLTACRIRDGRLFHLRTWIPECRCVKPNHKPEKCREKKVDHEAVDQAVADTFDAFEVWYLFGDPYKWQDYFNRWAARWPKRVIEVPTNVPSRMDDMLERFTTARDAGAITHDGNATLTEHVGNAVIAKGGRKPSKPREDGEGRVVEHYLKVVKKREGLFIDAAISGPILAFDARGQAIEDGALTDDPPPAPVRAGGDTGGRSTAPTEPDLNTVGF